jgi:hypothetical protein
VNSPIRPVLILLAIFACTPLRDLTAGISSDHGDAPGFWKDHSVIIGKVEKVTRTAVPFEGGVTQGDTILQLTPLGTLSGPFDGSVSAKIEAATAIRAFGSALKHAPKVGNVVLAAIWQTTTGERNFVIGGGLADYMRPSGINLIPLSGFADPSILDCLNMIRKVRRHSKGSSDERVKSDALGFWSSHSLIYGTIKARSMRNEEVDASIEFQTVARLAGEMDPGVVDSVDAHVNLKKLAMRSTDIPTHGNAIVLLEGKEGSYVVASERAAFMPGDRTPIFSVKDFADPTIAETLKKIRDLRAKEQEKIGGKREKRD